jgi:hypothetical protein
LGSGAAFSAPEKQDWLFGEKDRRGAVSRCPMDEIRFFHMQAERCREAALFAENEGDRRGLQQLAKHYEHEARKMNLDEIKSRASA